MSQPQEMWRCQMTNCGFIYDPERGDKRGKISPGVPFENLLETWHCPVCKASKRSFRCIADER